MYLSDWCEAEATVRIEQAKKQALKLFQRDGYQQLFEMLYDEIYEDYGPWRHKEDDPEWSVSLKILDGVQDFQLNFGDREVTVSLTSCEIGGCSASFGNAFFQQDYMHINLAVGMMQGEAVIVYEHNFYDEMNPINLSGNSDLIDIHEYHHRNNFYAMLDAYRELLKLRKARDDEKTEEELQHRYRGKFTF